MQEIGRENFPAFFMIMKKFIESAGFGDILEKVEAGERLSCDDGIRLYNSNDILVHMIHLVDMAHVDYMVFLPIQVDIYMDLLLVIIVFDDQIYLHNILYMDLEDNKLGHKLLLLGIDH